MPTARLYQTLTFSNFPVTWEEDCVSGASEGPTAKLSEDFSAFLGSRTFSCTGSRINSLISRLRVTAATSNMDVRVIAPPDWFPLMSIVLMYQVFYSKKTKIILLHGESSMKIGQIATLNCIGPEKTIMEKRALIFRKIGLYELKNKDSFQSGFSGQTAH